jgi:flagellar protein FliL
MAANAKPAHQPGKSSLVAFLGVTLMMAALGGGGGFMLVRHAMEVARAAALKQESAEKPVLPDAYTGTRAALSLPPIITTLATADTWVRLEAAIIYDEAAGKLPPALPLEITEDILAFLRTLTIAHISGPSGFVHLKQDLSERANVRSEGRVESVLLQVLVFE